MNIEYVKPGDKIGYPSNSIRVVDNTLIVQSLLGKARSFRAIHITDMHFRNWPVCIDRWPIAKDSLIGQSGVDYLFSTGDTAQASEGGLGIWNSFISGFPWPIYNTRGNHDGGLTSSDLIMPSDYYYFDIGKKWRIIVLYSQGGGNYAFGETQITWLSSVLKNTNPSINICILSHVPIVSLAAPMYYVLDRALNPVTTGTWNLTVDSHKDVYPLLLLFRQYQNVRVAISGHEHLFDDCTFENVRYLCGGALSADWWSTTNYHKFNHRAGYRVIDFYDDGTVSFENVYY